jgi:hypothetical protein
MRRRGVYRCTARPDEAGQMRARRERETVATASRHAFPNTALASFFANLLCYHDNPATIFLSVIAL